MDAQEAAAWQSAINSANNTVGVIASSSINKQTREWNEKMLNLQRGWALEDWNRQNEYNAPTSQMARLKAAGLNPNLVYGNGAQMPSVQIKSTDAPSWNPRPPEIPQDRGITDYLSVQAAAAQVDNLKAQNTVLLNEAMLKRAQTIATMNNADETGFDVYMKRQLEDVSMNLAQRKLDKVGADISMEMDENTRRDVMQSKNLEEATARIANYKMSQAKSAAEIQRIRASTDNLIKSGKLMDFEIMMNKHGVTKNDPIWWRVLAEIAQAINPQ